MNTLEQLEIHAAEIHARLSRGEMASKDDLAVMKIYNSLKGGKAFNAGKRNAKAQNQKLISGK